MMTEGNCSLYFSPADRDLQFIFSLNHSMFTDGGETSAVMKMLIPLAAKAGCQSFSHNAVLVVISRIRVAWQCKQGREAE